MTSAGPIPTKFRLIQQIGKALVKLRDEQALDDILSRHEIMAVNGFGGPLVAQLGVKVLPRVVKIARDNDARKSGALHAISFISDPDATTQLTALARDTDPQIASAALRALRSLSRAASPPAIRRSGSASPEESKVL